MLVQPALREYRTWIVDSRRWEKYQPRAGDIIVGFAEEIVSGVDALRYHLDAADRQSAHLPDD